MLLNQAQLSAIEHHKPVDLKHDSLMQAAVAIILRDGAEGTEFLMMQRAHHENDPWSGQMSFPGGKLEATDLSARAAAVRETKEEIGVELQESEYLGQLDDLYGLKVNDTYSVHVACFVYKLKREVEPQPNHEVADLVWLPLRFMLQPSNSTSYYHPHDLTIRMPALMINAQQEQILWGLSLRMLFSLFEILGLSLTALSKEDQQEILALDNKPIKAEALAPKAKKLLANR